MLEAVRTTCLWRMFFHSISCRSGFGEIACGKTAHYPNPMARGNRYK